MIVLRFDLGISNDHVSISASGYLSSSDLLQQVIRNNRQLHTRSKIPLKCNFFSNNFKHFNRPKVVFSKRRYNPHDCFRNRQIVFLHYKMSRTNTFFTGALSMHQQKLPIYVKNVRYLFVMRV